MQEQKQYYKNDLKYKKHRNLTEKDIINIKNTLGEEINTDMDTIEYRLKDMLKEDGTTLDISHLDLTTFPENIPISVQYLFCSNNNITHINSLKYLKNLLVFDCCCNNLQELPELPDSILEINCRHNKLNFVSIDKLKKIKRVDISYNNINNIIISESVEILICNNNNITNINNIPHLKKLICNDNKLAKLSEFPYLEILNCSKNNLKNISKYKNLIELHCSDNNINNIQELDNIKFIDCHKNTLNKLEYFPQLKELMCDYNNMRISSTYKIKTAIFKEDKNIMLITFI